MNEIQRQELNEQLFAAVKEGKVEKVSRLMEAGAGVDVVDEDGVTSLHFAAASGYTEIVKVLIEAGANVNGAGVLFDERTPLHVAAKNGHIETVRALIDKGASVNLSNKKGVTSLHFATKWGYTETVKALIEAGADVNLSKEYGETPLHVAAASGYTETVKALIEAGANVDIKDELGRTPFIIIGNRADVCEAIVNHIAKLEAAGLYVSEKNLQKKNEFIHTSRERSGNYLQHSKNYEKEIKKLERENRSLYDFLEESDVTKLTSIFEGSESVRSILDNQEGLKKQYPEYAYILINKANEVKKEIFLHNHRPLIDFLSTHYESNFQAMSFAGIRNFFKVHRNDFRKKLCDGGITLINFVDLEDITTRHVPQLKVKTFVEGIKNNDINSNLKCPSTEQPQELNRAFN